MTLSTSQPPRLTLGTTTGPADEGEFLTSEELAFLTGSRSRKRQIAWLKANCVRHFINCAGRPVIIRDYLRRHAGAPPVQEVAAQVRVPDFSKVR